MKILITSDWYKPAINGVVTSIINLSEELTKIGHDVKILTLSRNVSSYKEGNVFYIKSIPFNVYPEVRASVLLFDELLDELVAWKPDVVHSQCEFFTYTYGKLVAKRAHCPLVHTYHTMYEDYSSYLKIKKELGKHIIAFMSKNRLRDATVVVAPTIKVRRILKSYEITKEIKIVPTGIDLSKYDYDLKDTDIIKLKGKYNIPLNSKILLYLGRLGKEKNLIELLNSFNVLINSNKNVHLLIVGGGPFESKVRDTVEKLKLTKFVTMTGMVNPEEVPNFYKAADIFVSASQSETQGLTYIEAISNGLALVCKYDECLENVLIDGYNGYFFKDSNEFSEKINYILNNDLLDKLKSNSLKKRSNYSKEFFADSLVNIYNLAINLHKNKPKRIDLKLDHFGKILNVQEYWIRRFKNNRFFN